MSKSEERLVDLAVADFKKEPSVAALKAVLDELIAEQGEVADKAIRYTDRRQGATRKSYLEEIAALFKDSK